MRTAVYILLLFFVVPCAGMAQSDTAKPGFVKLYAVTAYGGAYLFSNSFMSQAEYQRMNPGNQLLKKDISAYEITSPNNELSGGSLSINANLVFYSKRKKKFNTRQELQIGLSYQTHEKAEQGYRFETKVPFDTLISNTSTTQYYIDTVKTSRYFYSHERTLVLTDVSHTFHSKQNRIFSWYGGYGLGYGRLINTTTYAEYYYNEEFKDQNNKTYDYPESAHARVDLSERSVIKGGNVYQVSLRIGGIMRFSKTKKNYMKRLAFNLEARPGARLSRVPGYGNITQLFLNINGGIKFYLNREAIK